LEEVINAEIKSTLNQLYTQLMLAWFGYAIGWCYI
jgi:hypothetical protein